jgi:hypothetical protein
MADKSVMEVVQEWLADILRGGANQTNITPITQVAADAGYTPEDLAGVPWGQAYNNACQYPGVPAGYPPVAPAASHAEVVRHVTQVTEVTNNNTQVFNITDNSQTIDNSIDLSGAEIDAGEGGFQINQDNNSATGGSAASEQGDANVADDGSLINTGTNLGVQNSGDESNVLGGTTIDLDFGRGGLERSPLGGEGTTPELTRVLTENPPNGEGGGGEDGGHDGGGLPGFPGGGPTVLNLNTGDAGEDIEQSGNDFDFTHNETRGDFSPIETGPGNQENNGPEGGDELPPGA